MIVQSNKNNDDDDDKSNQIVRECRVKGMYTS